MKKIIILFILSAFLFTGCSLHSAIEKFTDSPFIQEDTHNTVTAPTESPSGQESARANHSGRNSAACPAGSPADTKFP